MPLTPVMMLPNFDGSHCVLTPNLAATWLKKIDVEALDGLAVGGQELIGGVGGVSADLDHARALDALGQLGGKVHVLADRDRWGTLGAGSPLNELEPHALKARAATRPQPHPA